jgi:hypothetical protein
MGKKRAHLNNSNAALERPSFLCFISKVSAYLDGKSMLTIKPAFVNWVVIGSD